jgi:hypothetical protein
VEKTAAPAPNTASFQTYSASYTNNNTQPAASLPYYLTDTQPIFQPTTQGLLDSIKRNGIGQLETLLGRDKSDKVSDLFISLINSFVTQYPSVPFGDVSDYYAGLCAAFADDVYFKALVYKTGQQPVASNMNDAPYLLGKIAMGRSLWGLVSEIAGSSNPSTGTFVASLASVSTMSALDSSLYGLISNPYVLAALATVAFAGLSMVGNAYAHYVSDRSSYEYAANRGYFSPIYCTKSSSLPNAVDKAREIANTKVSDRGNISKVPLYYKHLLR